MDADRADASRSDRDRSNPLLKACGDCAACRDRDPSSCAHVWDEPTVRVTGRDGEEILQAMNTGAFAERAVVHRSQCQRLDEKIPSSRCRVACLGGS